MSRDVREKIALFTNVDAESVVDGRDASTIYEVPLIFAEQEVDELVLERLDLTCPRPNLREWKKFVDRVNNPAGRVTVGICGKYTEHKDAYKSIAEAFVHAGAANNVEVDLKWIRAEDIQATIYSALGIDWTTTRREATRSAAASNTSPPRR